MYVNSGQASMASRLALAMLGTLVATTAPAQICQVGAKIEGQWGNTWYPVTVLEAPDAAGNCLVTFDGYGSVWDTRMSADQIRPRGSAGNANQQGQTKNAGSAPQVASGSVPDGDYRCHKLTSGGGLIDIGDMTIDDGEPELAGLPDGWTILGVSVRGKNDRGELVIALDYKSASGSSDRMDCVAE